MRLKKESSSTSKFNINILHNPTSIVYPIKPMDYVGIIAPAFYPVNPLSEKNYIYFEISLSGNMS